MKMQLLFCNTFSCDSQGPSANWAVVKFPCMIAVDEIRIIAPGENVHPQLHDEQFVGKTSPSKFHLDFFSDDRSASMTTYEHVGSLEYAEGSTNRFLPSSALYSEKILLNGWFNHVTVAVYGGILSDIGMGASSLDLNVKTPSLIIHEKPEGRSVYIRGMQDMPELTKDLDKPEPLMSFKPTSNQSYLDLEEDVGRRDLRFQSGDDIRMKKMHSSYYDRRQGRNKNFGMHEEYIGDYPSTHPRIGGRKTLLPDVDPTMAFRTDISDRFSYKEKNRGYSASNQHFHDRHGNVATSELSLQKPKTNDGLQRNENKRESSRTSQDSEIKDLRQSLERNREESTTSEEQEKERNQEWIEGEYEEISDEETEEVAALQEIEEILDAGLLSPMGAACFNPFLMEPTQMMHFNHPAVTDFEVMCNALLTQHDLSQNGNEENITRFESLITKAKKVGKVEKRGSALPILKLNANEGREWVAVTEEIVPLIHTALPYFGFSSREKYDDYLSMLIMWIFTGLDNALASAQAIGTNLRMLKCGINLAHKLCLTTQEIIGFLTEYKLDDKLLDLLQMDSMASSVKIMIIHTLDAYLSWPSSISTYFNDDSKIPNANYTTLVELMLSPQAARVATALSRLANKVSLFHAMRRLKITVQSLVLEKIPSLQDDYDSEDDFLQGEVGDDVIEEEVVLEEEEEMVVMSSTSNDEDDDPQNPENRFNATGKKKKGGKLVDRMRQEQTFEKFQEEDSDVVMPQINILPLDSVISVSDVSLKVSGDILESLRLIIYTLQNIKTTITQLPKGLFPTASDLSEVADKNAKSCLFRMLEYYQILPTVQALLCAPVISAVEDIYEASYKLLDLLMSDQEGLVYLSSNSTCVVSIAKHLLSSSTGLSPPEIETLGTAPHLGAKLAFHVQCVQCLDQLQSLPEMNSEEQDNSEEAAEIFKVLYSLTFPTFGKYWVANVLSLEDNILPLLRFVQRVKETESPGKVKEKAKGDEGDNEKEEKFEVTRKKAVRKSAVGGFAVNILLIGLKMSHKVDYLVTHHNTIMNTMKSAPAGRHVEEIHEWLRPLENVTEEKNIITECMEFLKAGFGKLEWNTLMTSGPGLCTALRILCQVTNARHPYGSQNSCLADKIDTSLYRTALQVFSGGGLSVFVDGIEQLNKCFEYPCYSQHALTTVLSFSFHNLVSALSQNLLLLVHHLLNILLSTSDGKFQPKHLTKLLVRLYAGMYAVLRESGLEKLDVITELVISIFGIFIGKSIEIAPEDATKSKRTMVLKEIVQTLQDHCQTVVPGLILLSHLLPLPLPLVLPDGDIDEEAIKSVLEHRAVWEQPLTTIVEFLSPFIGLLCHSTCLPLLEVLVPLVQQIVDLSPSLASAIISSVMDACAYPEEIKDLNAAENDAEKQKERPEGTKYCYNPHPMFVLAEIATHPSAKATVLDCLHETKKDAFGAVWKRAQQGAKEKSPHLLDAATKFASVLLDPNIGFTPNLLNESTNFKETTLLEITRMACDGIGSTSLQTVLNSLLCLKSLSSTEVCFREIKTTLLEHTNLISTALEVMLKDLTVSERGSVSVVICLCTFAKQLFAPEKERTCFFTKAECKTAFKWDREFPSGIHPLVAIKSKLEEMDEDEGFCDVALDEVATLCESLNTEHELFRNRRDKSENHDSEEKEKKFTPLAEKFQSRPIWVNEKDDAAFSLRRCMLQGNLENSFSRSNINKHHIAKVDLVEMAGKSCTGFNLEKSFKELTESAKTTDIDKIRIEAKAKRLKKLETFSTRHGKTLTYIKRSHGLMTTNTRGRGRGRGGVAHGRHYDLFRQRKQNTSRPPSMHVDDFVAADEEDSNSTPDFSAPAPPSQPFIPPRRTTAPFKREFIPRGRGGRGGRGSGARGGFSNFIGTGANSQPISNIDKFRGRTMGSRPQDRFPRGRGRGRDPTRSFSPRGGFKLKQQQSWSFSPRNLGTFNPGGFRGGRAKSLLRIGRPLLPPPPPLSLAKWGMPPPSRRGRGYGKPRGKHLRSFTR